MTTTAVINQVGVDMIKINPFDQEYGEHGKAIAIVVGFTFIIIMVQKDDVLMPYYFMDNKHIHRVKGCERGIILSIILNHPEWKKIGLTDSTADQGGNIC